MAGGMARWAGGRRGVFRVARTDTEGSDTTSAKGGLRSLPLIGVGNKMGERG